MEKRSVCVEGSGVGRVQVEGGVVTLSRCDSSDSDMGQCSSWRTSDGGDRGDSAHTVRTHGQWRRKIVELRDKRIQWKRETFQSPVKNSTLIQRRIEIVG